MLISLLQVFVTLQLRWTADTDRTLNMLTDRGRTFSLIPYIICLMQFLHNQMFLSKSPQFHPHLCFPTKPSRERRIIIIAHYLLHKRHSINTPWGRREFKSRIRPPYPQRVVELCCIVCLTSQLTVFQSYM